MKEKIRKPVPEDGALADSGLRRERVRRTISFVGPYIGMVVVLLFFIVATKGAILGKMALRTLINQYFTILIVSAGAVFIYAQGYLDFSLGGVMALSMLLSILWGNQVQSLVPVALICLLLPLVCSIVVCWLSESLRVEPMLSSLCVLFICQGILLQITTAGSFTLDKSLRVLNTPTHYLIAVIVVVAIVWLLFDHTTLGRYLKAMGGNKLATKLSGVDVRKQKYKAYILCGLITGLAAFAMMQRVSTVNGSTNATMHLDIIVTLMLGGMPTKGGTKARVGNAVAGALTLGILSVGFAILETNIYYVQLIKGLLFLVVIGVGSRTPKGMPRAK